MRYLLIVMSVAAMGQRSLEITAIFDNNDGSYEVQYQPSGDYQVNDVVHLEVDLTSGFPQPAFFTKVITSLSGGVDSMVIMPGQNRFIRGRIVVGGSNTGSNSAYTSTAELAANPGASSSEPLSSVLLLESVDNEHALVKWARLNNVDGYRVVATLGDFDDPFFSDTFTSTSALVPLPAGASGTFFVFVVAFVTTVGEIVEGGPSNIVTIPYERQQTYSYVIPHLGRPSQGWRNRLYISSDFTGFVIKARSVVRLLDIPTFVEFDIPVNRTDGDWFEVPFVIDGVVVLESPHPVCISANYDQAGDPLRAGGITADEGVNVTYCAQGLPWLRDEQGELDTPTILVGNASEEQNTIIVRIFYTSLDRLSRYQKEARISLGPLQKAMVPLSYPGFDCEISIRAEGVHGVTGIAIRVNRLGFINWVN